MENSEQYQIKDLIYLVKRLRDPKTGCPWDIEQNYRSILPYTLEEVYEVVEAIERSDYPNLCEELGDLLLQIVLYTQFAQEESRFGFDDVVSGIVAKLIRRHPHVFPDGTLESRVTEKAALSSEGVLNRWDQIKTMEKQSALPTTSAALDPASKRATWLSGIPASMPAIQTAWKLQKKAAKVGFDWSSVGTVFKKLAEEVEELQQLLPPTQAVEGTESEQASQAREEHQQAILSEVGDILFVCVNIARHVGVDPEAALRSTNRKFVDRFNFIEDELLKSGKRLDEAALEEMEQLWEEAKKHLSVVHDAPEA